MPLKLKKVVHKLKVLWLRLQNFNTVPGIRSPGYGGQSCTAQKENPHDCSLMFGRGLDTIQTNTFLYRDQADIKLVTDRSFG